MRRRMSRSCALRRSIAAAERSVSLSLYRGSPTLVANSGYSRKVHCHSWSKRAWSLFASRSTGLSAQASPASVRSNDGQTRATIIHRAMAVLGVDRLMGRGLQMGFDDDVL